MKFYSVKKFIALLSVIIFLTACGGSGGSSATETPIDTIAPSVVFTPHSLVIDSGQSATVELTVSDNQSTGITPSIICDNGGSYDVDSSTYSAEQTTIEITTKCIASAIDETGNKG